MADDSIKISVTQEHRNPRRNSLGMSDSPDNGKHMPPPARRASVGSCHTGGNSKRDSTGKPSSGNSVENNIPHYLRASTGSCHDFCKYGRKNANEVKPWKVKPKRAVASFSEELSNTNALVGERKKRELKLNPSPKSSDGIKQNGASVVTGERKKRISMKLEPSPKPHEVIKQNTETVVPRGRKKTPTLKLEPSPDCAKVIKKKKGSLVPGERKKTATLKLDPSPEPPQVLKKGCTTLVPGERKKTTMVKVKSFCEPPEVIKQGILLPSKKVEVSSKRDISSGRKNSEKDPKMPLKGSPSSSSDASPKLKPETVGANGTTKSEGKTGKKTGPVKTTVKKFLVIPSVSLSPKSSVSKVLNLKAKKERNLKQVSPLKDKNRIPKVDIVQPCNEMVHKKPLHIIASDPGNSVFESLPTVQSPSALSPKSSPHENSQGSYSERDDLDNSVYTDSEEEDDDYISEDDEIVNPSGVETLQGDDDKRVLRKGKSSLPEEKDAAGAKLKFRRGSIVDIQSGNTGPRKLRFRRGRVLEGKDDQSGSKRRSYKKRSDDETKDSRIGAEKVVLKHQDVQGKNTKGLFNNVIEETASKLVETRKSKVKALVGAFETVISLQDS